MLSAKNVLLISHVYTTVPVEDLKEYLLNQKLDTVVYIKHPLMYTPKLPGSACYVYKRGKLAKTYERKHRKYPLLLSYLLDSWFSVYWGFKVQTHFDVTVCLDNMNTISGLLFKLFKRTKKVVFYTIDYIPTRFSNKLLNSFYHLIDRIAVIYSDKTWVLTQRMIDGREKLHGIKNRNNKQIVLPIGIWFSRIKRKSLSSIQRHTLVYAGGFMPHQGIQLMLKALPLIKKEVSDISFKIIGDGEYKEELEKLVKKYKLEKTVNFLGYFPSHKDVEEVLTTCSLGVGLYSKDLDIWSYYADPSKMKTYLAAGLPVLTTEVTYFAEVVRDKHCGLVVQYDEKDVAKKVIELLTNEEKYMLMRKNAIALARSLDWDTIFNKGFASIGL